VSLKDDLLAFAEPGPVAVEIRGKTFYVRVMTAYDSSVMAKMLEKHKADDGLETGRILSQLICDKDGKPIYDISNAAEVGKLSRLAPDVNMALFAASNSANGLAEGK